MTTDVYPNRTGKLVLGWGIVAALAVAVSWGRGIAMDLMIAALSVVEFFGGDDVLEFEFDWTGASLRALGTVAMVVLAWQVVRYQRISKGACGRCGRDGAPGRDRRSLATWAAWLTVLPAVGYAALKLYWGFGGMGGLADENLFGDVKPWSPGFADTAVMAAIGVGVALAMAYRRPRLPRWLLLTPAIIGCLMLLPVSVIGMAGNFTGANDFGPLGGLEPWVTWFVYGCFAVWAPCLTVVTLEYHYGTRGTCRACGRG